jgi:hypothetical protein
MLGVFQPRVCQITNTLTLVSVSQTRFAGLDDAVSTGLCMAGVYFPASSALNGAHPERLAEE